MALSPINSNYAATALNSTPAIPRAAAETAAKTDDTQKTSSGPNKDTFVKSSDTVKSADTAPKRLTADQLQALQEQQAASFQKMLSSMVTNQADKANIAHNGLDALNADLFSRLRVTPEQQAAATQAISEDGEWGVKAVASRIVDMAVSLSGGDSSKASQLRSAVEKGFKQAGVQWGQKLPSICQDTYDEVQKRFDYLEENGSMDGYEYKSSK